MRGLLDGITIFDLTHAAVGPWATMLLGAMGATVVKVEIPTGDLQQKIPPYQRKFSVLYGHGNLGKRSIVLDLKQEGDRGKAYQILRQSDVCIQNMRPGVAARLGFGYGTVQEMNPTIVYVDASAWGLTGPLGQMAGGDGPVQAFSAFTSLNGSRGGPGEYLRAYGYIDLNASQAVAMALLEAILRRARTGKSQYVETTMLGASMLMQTSRMAEYLGAGQAPQRWGSASPVIVPDEAFLCLDKGYLCVTAATDAQWRALCGAIGSEEIGKDARYATNAGRVEGREELAPQLGAIFASKPRRWWEVQLGKAGVPCMRPWDVEQIYNHPQMEANKFLLDMPVAHAGTMRVASPPYRFKKAQLRWEAPPFTGKHTQEVLAEYCGAAPKKREALPLGKEKIGGTLEGMTVVDATQGLCGPLAGHMLAELGARVIKIEPPEGDYARGYGPPFVGGVGAAYAYMNRLKEVRRLDVGSKDGAPAFATLAEEADVLLEDWGPGKAEALGLGDESLRRKNPKLVYLAISPFGEAGPLRDAPGSELAVQAMTNVFDGLGAIGEAPVRVGADIAQAAAAMHGVQGVLAALHHRQRTGEGERVAVSMLGSVLFMRGMVWAGQYAPDEWVGHPLEHATMPRATGYKTKDYPVFFTPGKISQEEFERMMRELGLEDCIANPLFVKQGELAIGTRVHAVAAKHLWERAFATMTSQEVIDVIAKYGGETFRVTDYEFLLRDEQVRAIGVLAEAEFAKGGKERVLTLPWRIAGATYATVGKGSRG
ncbi:MAG: hypothetical protein EXR49_05845 [Dehalococcoidia bacterium]|nr:hypothetical protein [Dehalococcoidia bacterium]